MVPGATGHPVPLGWGLLAQVPGGDLENSALSSAITLTGPGAPAESSGGMPSTITPSYSQLQSLGSSEPWQAQTGAAQVS